MTEKEEVKFGKWSPDEHVRYLKAMQLYREQSETISEKWKFIQEVIGTRSIQQCRSHHQKYQLKLKQWEKRHQQQHRYETTRPSRGMLPSSEYQMPPAYLGPYNYQQMNLQPSSQQQGQPIRRPDQHSQSQHWPAHPPQFYYYNQPAQQPPQDPYISNTPSTMAPPDDSSPPP